MSISTLPPDAGSFISLDEAKIMIARYRAEKENILAPDCKGKDILSICETFNRAEFDYILAQEGCAGLRFYFGMTEELKVKLIAVGVTGDNKDILPSSSVPATGDERTGIVEFGRPCPDYCPDTSLSSNMI